MGGRFIKRISAKAFAAGHREVAERFVSATGLTVMIGENLGHFDQPVTAAALEFIGYLRMQGGTAITEQAMIERPAPAHV